jgi:uncharacterized protein involved in response to NO
MTLLTIDETAGSDSKASGLFHHPLLRLGFRPFYLLAAAFAAVAIPAWLLRFYGFLPKLVHVDLSWHAHEMVFGFAVAVIVGFLYTAARNWTGLWTPRRAPLAAIVLLWLAGRTAMLLTQPMFAAAVDLLFLPVAAVPLYRVLRQANSKRNLFLIALLLVLALCNLGFHAARLGWLQLSPLHPVHAAILVIAVIETAIGGRVIPHFTANALTGARPVINDRRDRITLILTAGTALAWALALPAAFIAGVAAAAAMAQLTRLAGWKPLCTLRNPLLWILHASYAWLVLGLILLAMSALGLASGSAAFHVLAIGAMAGLIMGMITRTALGHTGRPLRASRAEAAMYLLIQLGVAFRLLAAAGPAGLRDAGLLISAACWTMAFLMYAITYGPYLLKARIDAREG